MVILPHWLEPLAAANHYCTNESSYVLLHSSRTDETYATRSILAFGAPHIQNTPSLETLAETLKPSAETPWDGAWFGYVGYELKHAFETLALTAPSPLALPNVWLAQFAHVMVFDHANQSVELHSQQADDVLRHWPAAANAPTPQMLEAKNAQSNMHKSEYLSKVQAIIEDIHAGRYYQANLTRKFFGELATPPQPLSVFAALCELSPAPFSALIVTPEFSILSSSPERFLSVNAQGQIISEPIKGSAPRGKTEETDQRQLENLKQSVKDNAENLMIVDLIRHDLARICKAGSVQTEEIATLHSFANVHHLISKIAGQKREDVTMVDVLRATFPPGSMTGAPKIAAMQACAQYEGMDRGVYSGALGWFGANGTCDLSVVIRTLILQGSCFEFQVGGGIVADSKPEAEWLETLAKASALAKLLDIDAGSL